MFNNARVRELERQVEALEARRDHLLEGHSKIVQRGTAIAKPNGTTKVMVRIATAAITGDDLDDAGAKAR